MRRQQFVALVEKVVSTEDQQWGRQLATIFERHALNLRRRHGGRALLDAPLSAAGGGDAEQNATANRFLLLGKCPICGQFAKGIKPGDTCCLDPRDLDNRRKVPYFVAEVYRDDGDVGRPVCPNMYDPQAWVAHLKSGEHHACRERFMRNMTRN